MLGLERQLESGATVESAETLSDASLVCSRLADGLLHDVRSPMMAISGFAEVLVLRHAPELGPDARRCLDNIVGATRRLEQMIELLSACARLGTGELERRPLALRELLRELGTEAGGGAVPLVSGDAHLLREAFAVLLRGAQRGEAADVRLELCAGRVRVEISDAEDAQRGAVELALARRALELHGGSLGCERDAAGRPSFVVELPAHRGAGA